MSKLIITAVPIAIVELIWDKCIPHLERVIKRAPNEIDLTSIKARLLRGNTMMVTVSEGQTIVAVNVLEVCTYGTGYKALFIPIIGGNRLAEWQDDFLKIAHAPPLHDIPRSSSQL